MREAGNDRRSKGRMSRFVRPGEIMVESEFTSVFPSGPNAQTNAVKTIFFLVRI